MLGSLHSAVRVALEFFRGCVIIVTRWEEKGEHAEADHGDSQRMDIQQSYDMGKFPDLCPGHYVRPVSSLLLYTHLTVLTGSRLSQPVWI